MLKEKEACRFYIKTGVNTYTEGEEYPVVKSIVPVCEKEVSCSCEDAEPVKLVTNYMKKQTQTFGLHNECKCDFWNRLCEDIGAGEACDYAAEYCCGDYVYNGETGTFSYLNSPSCYCDFSKYAHDQLGYHLKPKSIYVGQGKEFTNLCEDSWTKLSPAAERVSLEAIYEATNGQNWTRNDGWMSNETDHCKWHGITCNYENSVTRIELNGNNLVGQFPVYTRSYYGNWNRNWLFLKYGLANLLKLQILELADNKLTGMIDFGPLYNLEELTTFDVSGNQLIGEFEVLVAPSLSYLDLSSNGFTTMNPIRKYKRSYKILRHFDISNNAIQQKATDLFEIIPPNIEQLYTSNNFIYGNLPQTLNSLSKLRKFNISSNSLYGELPGFTESFATLEELDVSNQSSLNDLMLSNQNKAPGLSGSIPEDIWRCLSLKILKLAGNSLVGSISSLVSTVTVLEFLDLSSNHLDGSIPPKLGLLEGA